MLHIQTPQGCTAERNYVLAVIVGDWLGLPYRLSQGEFADTHLRYAGLPGEIRLPDTFFGQFARDGTGWLSPDSLPTVPVTYWDSRALADDVRLTTPDVPILFGASAAGGDVQRVAGSVGTDNRKASRARRIALPLDVFGTAFFMLARYEEAARPERDNHGRFPATASLNYRGSFLDRPIVDEYVEVLWSAMRQIWPGLKRKPRQARTLVSCDVDSPFAFDGRLGLTTRRIAGDLLKRRSPRRAWRNALGQWRARRGDHGQDPHRLGLEFIMNINERAGRSAAFYFIPVNTHPQLDKRVSLDDPRMRAILREIDARGHEIGIHPGYNTYRHPEAMAHSVQCLRRVLSEENIAETLLGGRQHYLRWQTPTTARLWEENELDYDSTLSFADRPGFRCGTCREYPFYDLEQRCSLRLRERPLIVMECSVIAERYMGLGYSTEALDLMLRYREICHRFDGDFTLLWHNSHLGTEADREFYEALIE